MGCDIHGVIEVKTDDYRDGELSWHTVTLLDDITPRDYSIFGYLFGVRGRCKTDCARRGYPEGVAWHTKYIYSNMCDGDHEGSCEAHMEDWHSLTYITWNELKPHLETVRAAIHGDERWNLIFDTMEWLASRYGDMNERVIESTNVPMLVGGEHDTSRVRMIVWFDN